MSSRHFRQTGVWQPSPWTANSAHDAEITAIGFNPEGHKMVTASVDGVLRIWQDHRELESPEITSLMGHREAVTGAGFAAGGTRVVSSGSDKTIRIWDPTQQSVQRTATWAGGSLEFGCVGHVA